MEAVARMPDSRKERQLWDEVHAIADHKYGWGDGLPLQATWCWCDSEPGFKMEIQDLRSLY
jgi:hypothetical protein